MTLWRFGDEVGELKMDTMVNACWRRRGRGGGGAGGGVFRDQGWPGLEVLDPRIRIPGSRRGMPLDFYIENN